MSEDTERRAPVVLLVGAVAMIVLIGVVYFAGRYAPVRLTPRNSRCRWARPNRPTRRKFNSTDLKVARATNFLNQEATFVFGTTANNGPRAIRQIEVTLEFHDVFQQVVLRDKQRLFSPTAAPLWLPTRPAISSSPTTRMPAQWNQAPPTVKITGLALQ